MRSDYKSDASYVLQGSLLNEIGRAINALGILPDQGESGRGVFHYDRPQPITIVGVVQVTDSANTCGEAESQADAFAVPCSSHNLYGAKFIGYDGKEKDWQIVDHDLELDAGAVYGRHQGLFKGEKCGAYYDPICQRLVPMFPVPQMYVAELITGLAESDGTTASSAIAYLLVRNTDTNGLSRAKDADNVDMIVNVYSWCSLAQSAGSKWNTVRDAFGDLWISTGNLT